MAKKKVVKEDVEGGQVSEATDEEIALMKRFVEKESK